MFVYFAYHISVNLCVYIAPSKMFIVQLFIKCSSFIGGIKLKVICLHIIHRVINICFLSNCICVSYIKPKLKHSFNINIALLKLCFC